MKFKLDENLPGEGVLVLRAAGHDAVTLLDQGLGGRPDPEIFAVVQAEGRALITLDVGFGNIRTYTPRMSAGIIVLRLGRQSLGDHPKAATNDHLKTGHHGAGARRLTRGRATWSFRGNDERLERRQTGTNTGTWPTWVVAQAH